MRPIQCGSIGCIRFSKKLIEKQIATRTIAMPQETRKMIHLFAHAHKANQTRHIYCIHKLLRCYVNIFPLFFRRSQSLSISSSSTRIIFKPTHTHDYIQRHQAGNWFANILRFQSWDAFNFSVPTFLSLLFSRFVLYISFQYNCSCQGSNRSRHTITCSA